MIIEDKREKKSETVFDTLRTLTYFEYNDNIFMKISPSNMSSNAIDLTKDLVTTFGFNTVVTPVKAKLVIID